MPDSKPTTLEEMVARLKPDRTAFAAVYDRLRLEKTPDFKTVAARAPAAGESEEARNRVHMLTALRRAEQDGWLDKFTPDILSELTDDPGLAMESQAVTNPEVNFDHIDNVTMGSIKAALRCCRVVCGDDGTSRGSGFLIGPQLVLTNWHVVRRQIEAEQRAIAEGKPRPPVVVHVEFDMVRKHDGTVSKPVVEAVADKVWLAVCSDDGLPEGTADNGLRQFPEDLTKLQTSMDYAVIELANPVGYVRGWYDLSTAGPSPEPDAQGVLIQFPGDYAMRVTPGAFRTGTPTLPARVRHGMNAIGGSSGGLCATPAYEPLALHQGSVKKAKRRDTVEGKRLDMGVDNVAIPLALIAEKDGQTISLRALAAPALVHRTLNGQPIIGRNPLRRSIHETIHGENRIIVVRNNYDSRTGKHKSRIGKSFTIQILEAMTRPAETLIRTISAEKLPSDAFDAARALAGLFRDAASGEAVTQAFALIDAAGLNGDSTQDADVRSLAGNLFAALRLAAGDRMLWLVIDDLDLHPIDSSGATANLLNGLYELISTDPKLRAVLIGTSPSFRLPKEVEARDDGPLAPLEPAEIEQWISLARGRDRPFQSGGAAMVQKIASTIQADNWRPQDPPLSETERIAQILQEVIGPHLA